MSFCMYLDYCKCAVTFFFILFVLLLFISSFFRNIENTMLRDCCLSLVTLFSVTEWKVFPLFLFEPADDKTYNKTCVTSKDLDHSVHPTTMARVLGHHSLDSMEAVHGTCDQRRLWSDCAEAQADLSLRLSHKSYCSFVVRWLISFCLYVGYYICANLPIAILSYDLAHLSIFSGIFKMIQSTHKCKYI